MTAAAGKLLIKPGDRVRVESAVGDLEVMLGPLPKGARIASEGEPDVMLAFFHNSAAFRARFPPGFTSLQPLPVDS